MSIKSVCGRCTVSLVQNSKRGRRAKKCYCGVRRKRGRPFS